MTDTLLENAVIVGSAADGGGADAEGADGVDECADVLSLQTEHRHIPCICFDRKTLLHAIFLCEVRGQDEQVRKGGFLAEWGTTRIAILYLHSNICGVEDPCGVVFEKFLLKS